MRRHFALIAAIAVLGIVQSATSYSAEIIARPPVERLSEAAKMADCRVSRTCLPPPVCPPGNPCYPLYGAYGPYGGTQYWGAYTAAGWGW
jgi:hypothetical protein